MKVGGSLFLIQFLVFQLYVNDNNDNDNDIKTLRGSSREMKVGVILAINNVLVAC